MKTSESASEANLSADIKMNVQVQATARVIANFAWQHFKAATTFRDMVVALEAQNTNQPFGPFFEDIRSYSSACIMSAVASLESLINEFFMTPEGPLRKQLPDFEVAFWGRGGIEWKSPLEKYQIALEMLGQKRIDEKAEAFRDAWALVELRNSLVHYKPTWDADRQRRIELVDVLKNRYKLSPFPDAGSDFVTMRSMSSGCAQWVIATTGVFMKEFHARAQIDEHKMSAFFRLADA